MSGPTVTVPIHAARRGRCGAVVVRSGPAPAPVPAGRVPRVARLMALAVRCDGLLARGEVASRAELAAAGGVSRARVTQILNLLHLAPDVQEELLFLPPTVAGRDAVKLADLQPIAAVLDWRDQRRRWQRLAADRVE